MFFVVKSSRLLLPEIVDGVKDHGDAKDGTAHGSSSSRSNLGRCLDARDATGEDDWLTSLHVNDIC